MIDIKLNEFHCVTCGKKHPLSTAMRKKAFFDSGCVLPTQPMERTFYPICKACYDELCNKEKELTMRND